MHANSSPVLSAQVGVHQQLLAFVERHASTQFLKPISDYNRKTFDASMAAWRMAGEPPLILDAGCGVGVSTLHLARQFPDHFVIGIDQSADRLARNTRWEGEKPRNYCLMRADLVDYWRLMYEANVRPTRHYLLYPNPWPKAKHLGRRWHGHAVFPTLVALGGYLECRSNWRTYVEELQVALSVLTNESPKEIVFGQYETAYPMTPFEQKYLASGHALWQCQAQLSIR